MSCFGGRMLEYQNISIDRFDGVNLKSTAFFLSHCHEDHTAGLKEDAFEERLKSRNDVFLYCSEVTKILLRAAPKYQHLYKYIRALPVDEPTIVPIPETDSAKTQDVTITLLHAGHCPGSVMFLFEGSEGTVLYTGDFRWESDKISQMSALHQDGKVKLIKSLYVDTTFCHPDSIYIPPRMECMSVVCSLVLEWLSKDDKNVVHIVSKTNYGHEPLFKEVAEHTGQLVHVSEAKCKIYKEIQGLRDTFTQDPEKTRVHACHREKDSKSYGGLPCRIQPSRSHVMKILPSTMFFTMKMRLQQKDVVIYKNGLHRVCFSFHSSLLEVRDLVTYLAPERVRPNVKPLPDKDLSMVQRRLNEFLKMKNSAKVRLEMDSQRPLGLLRPSKIHKPRHRDISVSSDSEELDFGTQSIEAVRKVKYGKLTPGGAVSEQSGEDESSSYGGSQREDSEISDLCLDNDNEDDRLSTPPRSLLDAINSQEMDNETLEHRICVSGFEEESFEKALSLEQVQEMNKNKNEEVDKSFPDNGEYLLKSDNITCVEAPQEGNNEINNVASIQEQNAKVNISMRDISLKMENGSFAKNRKKNDENSSKNVDDCLSNVKNEISDQNCSQNHEDRSLNGSFDLFEDNVNEECQQLASVTKCKTESVLLSDSIKLSRGFVTNSDYVDYASQGFVTNSSCADYASQGFVVQNQDSQMEHESDGKIPVQEQCTYMNKQENQARIWEQSKDGTSTRSCGEEKQGKKISKLSAVDILFESGESSSSESDDDDVQIVKEEVVMKKSMSELESQGHLDINTFTDSRVDLIMEEPTQNYENEELHDLTDQGYMNKDNHSVEQFDLTVSSGEVSYHGDHLDLTVSSGETSSKTEDHHDLDEEIKCQEERNCEELQVSRSGCQSNNSKKGTGSNNDKGNKGRLKSEITSIRSDLQANSNHTDRVTDNNNHVCDSDSDATLPPTPLKHGSHSFSTTGTSSNVSELLNSTDNSQEDHLKVGESVIHLNNYDSDSDATLPPTPLKNKHRSAMISNPKEKQANSSPSFKQTNIIQYLSPPKNITRQGERMMSCSPHSDFACSPSLLRRRKKRTSCWLNSGHKHIVILGDDGNKRQKKVKRVIDLTQSDDDD